MSRKITYAYHVRMIRSTVNAIAYSLAPHVALINFDDSYIFCVWNVPGQCKGILRGDYYTFDYFTEYFILSRNSSVIEVLRFICMIKYHARIIGTHDSYLS